MGTDISAADMTIYGVRESEVFRNTTINADARVLIVQTEVVKRPRGRTAPAHFLTVRVGLWKVAR